MALTNEARALPTDIRGYAGGAVMVLAILAAIPAFWHGLSSLVAAWSVPEYSHGPIIPLLSLFLFLREMRAVPPSEAPVTDRWPGVGVAVMGLSIGVLGTMAQVSHIVTYGFIVWIAGVVLTTFGLRRGVKFWPAVLHLVFMLPLPQFVYWEVSSFLMFVSSELGVALIRLMGIPVYLDGNIIDLGVYKLQVAEACSGLRYLFPMLSFSYIFAVLYNGPIWHKAILLLSAAPITVLMNSFRIGVIGVMVDNFGIEHAEGFLHTFEGWIIFVACVLILFLLAIGLQRVSRDRRGLSETLDIEFEGLDRQAMRLAAVAPSPALIVAASLTALVALGGALAPERSATRVEREPFALFPVVVEDWRAQLAGRLDPEVEAVLGADDYYSARFSQDAADLPIDVFMAFYHNQMDGTGIHSPEVCIPAGGWEVSDWSTTSFVTAAGDTVKANRAIIQKGVARQLVYFWFELRGERATGEFEAKRINLVDSLRTGRSDGALVRLITPMRPGAADAEADARLQTFADVLTPLLPRFAPR